MTLDIFQRHQQAGAIPFQPPDAKAALTVRPPVPKADSSWRRPYGFGPHIRHHCTQLPERVCVGYACFDQHVTTLGPQVGQVL